MPYAAPRLCSRPGCTELGKHSHSRREYDQRRGSSTARGLGAQWQKIRARKLAEEPLCRICKEVRGIIVAADSVDHIVPRAKGGTDAWENLQSTCLTDNNAKGDRDNWEYRASVAREVTCSRG